MTNYRVSTNTNNSSNGTTEQTNKKQQKKQETRKIDQLRLFTAKHEKLKVTVHLKTSFAGETHPAESN
jgi:hypothetical protein